MATLYITKTELGFEMEDSEQNHYGVAETLEEAKESAQVYVEMGTVEAWTVNE